MNQNLKGTQRHGESVSLLELRSPQWHACCAEPVVTVDAMAEASKEDLDRALRAHRNGTWINDAAVATENIQALCGGGGLVTSRHRTSRNTEIWVASWFEPAVGVARPRTMVATTDELNDLSRWRLTPTGEAACEAV